MDITIDPWNKVSDISGGSIFTEQASEESEEPDENYYDNPDEVYSLDDLRRLVRPVEPKKVEKPKKKADLPIPLSGIISGEWNGYSIEAKIDLKITPL